MKALQKGAYIKHFQYGLGVVTEFDSDRTSIDFDLHGMKKFVTTMMVVELAEGTPPKRQSERAKSPLLVAAVAAGLPNEQRNHRAVYGVLVEDEVREYTFTCGSLRRSRANSR